MKRLLILACLSLAACSLNGPIKPPATVASATVLDERIGIGATVSYTAAATLGTALAKAGVIDKVAFRSLDQKGYDAQLAVKAAYDAGNSASYEAAVTKVYGVIAQINALVK